MIPTRKATLGSDTVKQTGRTEAEQKGFETREMAPPEHARRWDRLAKNIVPDSRIPDGARK